MTLQLIGRINEHGQLELAEERGSPSQGLEQLLQIEPMSGAAIVEAGLAGGWKELDLPEGQTWVENQRRRRAERRRW